MQIRHSCYDWRVWPNDVSRDLSSSPLTHHHLHTFNFNFTYIYPSTTSTGLACQFFRLNLSCLSFSHHHSHAPCPILVASFPETTLHHCILIICMTLTISPLVLLLASLLTPLSSTFIIHRMLDNPCSS